MLQNYKSGPKSHKKWNTVGKQECLSKFWLLCVSVRIALVCEYLKAQFLSHGRGLFFSHKNKLRGRWSKDGIAVQMSPRNLYSCFTSISMWFTSSWWQDSYCLSRQWVHIPGRKAKNFLSNLGFLFGKESPLLGLSVCILLTKLCQMATPSYKGLWKLVSSVSSLPYRERQGRSVLGWLVSQSTVFVKICYKFLFLKAINLEFDT